MEHSDTVNWLWRSSKSTFWETLSRGGIRTEYQWAAAAHWFSVLIFPLDDVSLTPNEWGHALACSVRLGRPQKASHKVT